MAINCTDTDNQTGNRPNKNKPDLVKMRKHKT